MDLDKPDGVAGHCLAVKCGVFVLAVVLAGGFAVFTDQVWEDYFITARSSMNLATGHGLVFSVGERLHTFTSPLGVLLPAGCMIATGLTSEAAAVWLFRLFSIMALGSAAVLLFSAARKEGLNHILAAALVLLVLLDGKTLGFSINGMETGFVLLFVAWAMWAVCSHGPRRWMHFGLAWGGLMWTRPDGFIYTGAMAIAVLLFRDQEGECLSRSSWFQELLYAAGVCAVVYLPWFAWAWLWYGTPVPHTVLAKANVAGERSLWGAVQAFATLPVRCWWGGTALDSVFTPFYVNLGGWPAWVKIFSRVVAWCGMYLWVLPRIRSGARVSSFVACVAVSYLDYFPNYPYPWYFPAPAWLSLFADGVAGSQMCAWLARRGNRDRLRPLVCAVAGALVLVAGILSAWCSIQQARLAREQQRITDGGSRRSIGLWLKAHAAPGDRVFLESLGYIGYYSGLTMLDYPGLASREVVTATKGVGFLWERLIGRLAPGWLVLRAQEAAGILHREPGLLDRDYSLVRVFDASDQIDRLDVRGRDLLAFDSVFLVYRKNNGSTGGVPDVQPGDGGSAPSLDDPVAEVLRCLRRAALLKRDPAGGLLLLGDIQLQRGRSGDAAEAYRSVLARQPACAQAHLGMGNVSLAEGRADEAVAHFAKALEAKTDYPEARNNLGNALFQKGRLAEAAGHYQHALALKADYTEAAYNLANTHLELGRMAEARTGYERVLAARPEDVAALNNLAWILATAGPDSVRDGERAVTLARQADVLTGGRHAIVLHTLAAAFAETGRFDDAIATAERALAVAETQRNRPMAAAVREQLASYHAQTPWRDPRGRADARR